MPVRLCLVAACVATVVGLAGCEKQPKKPRGSRGGPADAVVSIPGKDSIVAIPSSERPLPRGYTAGGYIAAGPSAKPSNKTITITLGPGLTMDFVEIPDGMVLLGDPAGPRRRAMVHGPFYLGKTEVTQDQWRAVMPRDPSLVQGGQIPVHRLNWDDCQAFLAEMNRRFAAAPIRFVLPSEAQWEFACRANAPTKADSPDDERLVEQYAWLATNSSYAPQPVGRKRPNAWGLHDMLGNISEWCGDVLGPNDPELRQETTFDPGPWYVVRGGNYRDGTSQCTSYARVVRRPTVPMRNDGVRLAGVPK